jgi:ATP-binding cassette, subfamily C, bacterial
MSPLTTWCRDALDEVRVNAADLEPFLRQGLSKLREKATALFDDRPSAQAPTAAAQVLPEQASPEEGRDARAKREIMKEWRLVARRTFIPVIVFSVFINLLMLTIPVYLFQLSDRVLTSRSTETLLMLTVIALSFIGVLSLLDIMRRHVLSGLATRFETVLGGALLASIITTARASDTANLQALRSLHQVKSFISSPVMLLLLDAPLAPIYFAAVFLIHPDLGFIALAAGVVLITVAAINQRATAGHLGQASLHAANADAEAEALARNSQVVNAMGMLNESILHWGREQARSLSVQSDALQANIWLTGTAKCARLITQIIMLGVGAYLALGGNLTGGMMIAASVIAGRGLLPLEGMIEGWRSVVQARSAYARVRAAVQGLIAEQRHLLLPRPTGRLTVDRALYLPPGSKEAVLNGVSFELQPGESLAIVGPAGSGKSTLARIIVGCLHPTAGKVRLDGTELRNWDRRQFGICTGYLPQEVELFPGSIKENICRMRHDLPDESVYQAAMFAGVHDVIAHLPAGYETVLERSGAPLSGGQKQRIALARAFFGEPCIIVLDEPNSNLDAAGEQALAETLQRSKEKGITVVVITQRPSILNIMDKLLVLRAGRAEAFGPPDEILRRLTRATNGAAHRSEVAGVEGNGSEPMVSPQSNGSEPTASPQPGKRRPGGPRELGNAS